MIRISDTVVLKFISLDDVRDIFNVINQERAYLRKWLPFVDSTLKESDTFSYVQDVIEHNGIQYSIFENDRFVGLVGFRTIDEQNKKAEIGYWLSQTAQKKGIMVRSVKELIAYAFSDLGMNRIQIRTSVDNLQSRAVPERLGFIFEGIEHDGELLVDNKFTDLAVYGLLKKDFKE